MSISKEWQAHLSQYLAEYTDGGFVVSTRLVSPDMLTIMFRDGAHAVKAVALSGHRVTTCVELRVNEFKF